MSTTLEQGRKQHEDQLAARIDELLALPITDPKFVPLSEEIMRELRSHENASEAMLRYREIRQRMGQGRRDFFAPPNSAYTLRSAS